jgi:hypothetical protein
MDTLRGYWLHRNALGKVHDGRIILNEEILRLPCSPPNCPPDAVRNHPILKLFFIVKSILLLIKMLSENIYLSIHPSTVSIHLSTHPPIQISKPLHSAHEKEKCNAFYY